MINKNKLILSIILVALVIPIALFFDKSIMVSISELRLSLLNYLFILITNLGNGFSVLLISALILICYKPKRKYLPLLAITILITMVLVELMKLGIARPRPEIIHFIKTSTSSFPSGHTAGVFAILALMQEEFPIGRWLWLSFAILVGFSRIYLGVHYLSDVLAGALLGYLVGYFILKLEKKNKFSEKLYSKI